MTLRVLRWWGFWSGRFVQFLFCIRELTLGTTINTSKRRGRWHFKTQNNHTKLKDETLAKTRERQLQALIFVFCLVFRLLYGTVTSARSQSVLPELLSEWFLKMNFFHSLRFLQFFWQSRRKNFSIWLENFSILSNKLITKLYLSMIKILFYKHCRNFIFVTVCFNEK